MRTKIVILGREWSAVQIGSPLPFKSITQYELWIFFVRQLVAGNLHHWHRFAMVKWSAGLPRKDRDEKQVNKKRRPEVFLFRLQVRG
jgi:hypothetical protein